MRVICVDKTPRYHSNDVEGLNKLVEGNMYTVIGNPHPCGYLLKEVATFNPNGFLSERFVPCSEIDELELIKERELVTV